MLNTLLVTIGWRHTKEVMMDTKNLEPGWYYIMGTDKRTRIDYYYGEYWECSWWEDIIEVLAPVPSFEEFKKNYNLLGGL